MLALLFLDVPHEPNSVDWPWHEERKPLPDVVLQELYCRFLGKDSSRFADEIKRLTRWPVWHRDGALCDARDRGRQAGLAFVSSEIRPSSADGRTSFGYALFGAWAFDDLGRYAWVKRGDFHYVPSLVHVLDFHTGAVALSFRVPDRLSQSVEERAIAERQLDQRAVLRRTARRPYVGHLFEAYAAGQSPQERVDQAYSSPDGDTTFLSAESLLNDLDLPIADAMNPAFSPWLREVAALAPPPAPERAFVDPIPPDHDRLPGREDGVWYSFKGADNVVIYEPDGTERVVRVCEVYQFGCGHDD